ncbi:polysaccharide deacetylase family protein [Planktothrix mougeotii]|uniref:Polysaccharide deacetylase family protein n=1 Tax=Planktothrix mougeotii LEGE 06226 TaxID=1828728 RepID=A0ABR9UBP5_9CYAN|nr:polysaccharide deacetylase family protein [Planktothrix mougeotii]MBE9143606.1 polysaccharide deacetylase family protein [Planktothrix mougeotii LEGE 06226]
MKIPIIQPEWFRKNRVLLVFLISLLCVIGLNLPAFAVTYKTSSVRIPIFGLHDIIDEANINQSAEKRLQFDNDYFKQDLYTFLNYLAQNNYWFLTTQDLFTYFIQKSQPIPQERIGQKPIMISFDDGYEGVHQNVLPILKDLEENYNKKVKIVWFINPGLMGVKLKDFIPHVSCEELRDGYKRGYYDIQSHGQTHEKLTLIKGKKLKFELEQAKLDLRTCMQDLDKNKWVAAHFAYPFGKVNRRVEKSLSPYYLTGYVYDGNMLRINRYTNKYRLSRITVNRYTSPRSLIRIAKRATTLRKS